MPKATGDLLTTKSSSTIDIYLEVGEKKTFAGALDWPGWCRSGKDETSAVQSLFDHGPRYAQALHAAKVTFHAPKTIEALHIVERLKGNATTDFGAPGIVPDADAKPMKAAEFERLQAILKAAWSALDQAVKSAADKELHKGPRGGGRDVDKMIEHVLGSQSGYLTQLAWKTKSPKSQDIHDTLHLAQQNTMDALHAVAHGDMPTHGPRGGKLWTPRYFVRRSVWHLLDHAWEIEDRIQ